MFRASREGLEGWGAKRFKGRFLRLGARVDGSDILNYKNPKSLKVLGN